MNYVAWWICFWGLAVVSRELAALNSVSRYIAPHARENITSGHGFTQEHASLHFVK